MMPSRETLEWTQNQLVAVLMALSLTIGMVSGGTISLYGIAGGLLIYGLELLRQRRLIHLDPVTLGFGLSFIALIWIAETTALAPHRTWSMNWKLVSIVLPLMVWFQQPVKEFAVPRWVVRVVPWLMLAVLALLLLEFYSGGKYLLPLLSRKPGRLVDYNRGLSYVAVLIWPLVYWLVQSGRGKVAAVVAAGLVAVAWCSPSRGAVLAVALGIVFWTLARWTPRVAVGLAVVLLAVSAFGSLAIVPWIFDHYPDLIRHLPSSWQHRVEIWDYLLAWHLQSPFVGAGADVSATLPPSFGHPSQYKFVLGPGQHPHHAFLQLWLELGVLGWAWGLALAAYVLAKVNRLPDLQRAGGLAAWAAFLTLASGSFNLWTDSFLAVSVLAIAGMRSHAERSDAAPARASDTELLPLRLHAASG